MTGYAAVRMPVGMMPVGEKPENYSFNSIRYVFFARRRERLSPQRWLITLFRIGEISSCSGIMTTGRAYVNATIMRKQGLAYNNF